MFNIFQWDDGAVGDEVYHEWVNTVLEKGRKLMEIFCDGTTSKVRVECLQYIFPVDVGPFLGHFAVAAESLGGSRRCRSQSAC